MKKAIILVAALLVALALLGGCNSPAGKDVKTEQTAVEAIKARGKLIMLTNSGFPPFEYLGDDNKPAGVDIDVAAEIAKDLGVELEVVDMDFDGLIGALTSGKGDLIAAGMSITEERKSSVDFSVEYVVSAQYIIVKEGSNIKSLEDLAGMRVGVQTGTTGDLIITDEIEGWDDNGHVKGAIEGTGAEVFRYKTALEAALDLNNDRLDAVIVDKHPAEAIAASNPGLVVTSEAMSEEESYAIAVNKGQDDLLEAINKTLNRLMDEGAVEQLLLEHTGG